jgi:hypothetical protein
MHGSQLSAPRTVIKEVTRRSARATRVTIISPYSDMRLHARMKYLDP